MSGRLRILSKRRVYAHLGMREPDGICVDSEGGIWAASFNTGESVRVLDGGQITDRISCNGHAVACQLGGKEGATLFCSTCAGTLKEMQARRRLGAVYIVEMEIPGAGFGCE